MIFHDTVSGTPPALSRLMATTDAARPTDNELSNGVLDHRNDTMKSAVLTNVNGRSSYE
jgi:hypothetical protein